MYTRQKIEQDILTEINSALQVAVDNNELNLDLSELPQIVLEVPREKGHGDYATNAAMQLARFAKTSPRNIAESIINHFNSQNLPIKDITIAGPGFINFNLTDTWLSPVIAEVNSMEGDYGKTNVGENKKVNIEYVSANPTGPMHLGNARGGAIGNVLSTIFDWTGHDVTEEFYVNDAGNQIEKFADSLEVRYQELNGNDFELTEDLYQGIDIRERVKEYLETLDESQKAELESIDASERKKLLVDFGLNKNLTKMKKDLEKYGINYDVWFSEKSLYDNKEIEEVLELLKETGKTYEKNGALWFKSTDFGLDKDDVLVRNNGIPTYYLGDIAYHYNKFKRRNFDRGINIWGADHYGHIERLKKALEALGIKDKLDIITMQLVKIKKGDENLRLSKRKGNSYSLDELIDEIGKDATRFFFNLRSPDSQFTFDLDLAIEESNENPVFYVQYAHARIASILRKIENFDESLVNPELLVEPEEKELLTILSEFPNEIVIAQEMLDPSRITKYAQNLASAFHSFYNACRVNVEDENLRNSRIALVKAVKQVLKNSSDILGIEAPEAM